MDMVISKNMSFECIECSPIDYELGVRYDHKIKLMVDGKQEAVVYLSDMKQEGELSIEWISTTTKGKGFMRIILEFAATLFKLKSFYLEAIEGTEPIYEHLGAIKEDITDYDRRGVTPYILDVEALFTSKQSRLKLADGLKAKGAC